MSHLGVRLRTGQSPIGITTYGGLSERVGRTSSILAYSRLVCGFELNRPSWDRLLA
jgi:hypothetical protein